ncbi:conserved hypothetical protein [Tenacibaculum maritimum]|nr:conserved hypothetical protein [Tenacibaculum maritimum]
MISKDETLVRYVFESDFKGKNVLRKKINFSNFLLPYLGGVSIQRESYCSENECKKRAKLTGKVYVGFYVFRKSRFLEVRDNYILNSRKNFQADLFSTPLNSNNDYLPLPINNKSFEILEGNPSHADLIYINPAPVEGETPKTAMRSFVRKLYNERELIIDSSSKEDDYKGTAFKLTV